MNRERESDVNKKKVMKLENRKRDADSWDLMWLLCFYNPACKHSCHYVSWLICLIFTDLHCSRNADIREPEGKKLLWVEKQHLWASQPAYEPSNQLFSFSFIYITSVDNNFVRCLTKLLAMVGRKNSHLKGTEPRSGRLSHLPWVS